MDELALDLDIVLLVDDMFVVEGAIVLCWCDVITSVLVLFVDEVDVWLTLSEVV